MSKFQTQFDPKYKGCKGSSNPAESLTIPDLSLSVRELFLNHTRNRPLGAVEHEGIYTEDFEVPTFDDITDRQDYLDTLKEEQERIEKEIAEIDKIRKEAAEKVKAEKESPLSDKAKKSLKEPPTKSEKESEKED